MPTLNRVLLIRIIAIVVILLFFFCVGGSLSYCSTFTVDIPVSPADCMQFNVTVLANMVNDTEFLNSDLFVNQIYKRATVKFDYGWGGAMYFGGLLVWKENPTFTLLTVCDGNVVQIANVRLSEFIYKPGIGYNYIIKPQP